MVDQIIKPFLKWAGGKRWFVANHQNYLSAEYDRYIEPFLGAGSVFFHLKPEKALLSDSNKELIETYQALKTRWRKVLELLEHHQAFHSKDHYYQVRENIPTSKVERAARFIYLNRTCWNGLYRVNLQGKFNVPIGTKNTVLFPDDDFKLVSKCLRSAEITDCDFEETIDKAGKGDFLFVDPPYTVKHNYNGFVKYNEKIFSWADQERLFHALNRARIRGASIVVTNAKHQSVSDLYSKGFDQFEVDRTSLISGKPQYRARFEELVMVSR